MTGNTSSPFWRSKRIISILIQAAFAIVVAAAFFYIIKNTISGMEKIGIKLGFDFLSKTAGFSIGEKIIDYSPADSYARAVLVGITNTLKVAIVGIILTSIIGVAVGVARLSSNWIVNKISGLYIDIIRNTPLLVQIFIWYFAVFLNLPKIQESISWCGIIYFSNRGAVVPWFETTGVFWPWCIFLSIGISSGVYLWKKKTMQQIETGEEQRPLWWAAGAVFVSVVIAFIVTQKLPCHLSIPTIEGSMFVGGYKVTPEFASILIALVVYTSTYIAEIVRGGILAIHKGQTEAAKALGFKDFDILRLIIFPQTIRIIIPPVTSQYLNLIKNSSLAVAIGYPDLFNVSNTILNQTGRAVEMITIILLIYLSFSLATSIIMNIFNIHYKLVER